MSILEGAFLGLVQGFAEFLPISSSGHLNLLQALFQVRLEHQLLFNLLLHAGSLAAVGIFFWKDWVDMLLHPIQNRTLFWLFIASLPALAAKILFDGPLDYAETHNTFLGVCFLLTGVMLWLTQFFSRRSISLGKEKKQEGLKEALAMGGMQALGMLPGISRSGSTIFGGVWAGMDRSAAAKFSFMMSAPAIVAGSLSECMAVMENGVKFGSDLPAILIGVLMAFVAGYLSIRFFMKLIARVSLNGFAIYVTILGIVVIILQLTGVLVDVPVEQAVQGLAAFFG